MGKRIEPPICPTCGSKALLRVGSEMYPLRRDLWTKFFWLCPTKACEAWCGCHPGTKRPLGTLAGRELRNARKILHERMIDPLWKNAERLDAYDCKEWTDARTAKMIRNKARSRVYRFLADQMKIDAKDCHTGLFSLEQCRAAWRALRGVDYATIRVWAKMREDPKVIPFRGKKQA